MVSERARILEFAPAADSLGIAETEVSRLGRCGPDPRWREAVSAAIREARALLAPRALWTEVGEASLDGLFAGRTPVEGIARAGRRWAFVASIGGALEARVAAHFGAARFLEGVLLDAAGSVAVEALADAVEGQCAGGAPAERFSPGYCGWTLAGQPGLFRILSPGSIGVRLLPSRLMEPLKSVSGLVVSAEPGDLRVPEEACAQCDARGCTRRQSRHDPATASGAAP